MKWSQTLIPTMKETPTGAEIPSHIYMLRAGMISQVMAGAYAYLPLGWRALQKATNIVRDEMDKAGGVELFMTALCPQSLYEQTDRVEAFGNVLIKTTLVRGGTKTPVVFCPTHEEEITNIVSQYVSSYRQLPLLLKSKRNSAASDRSASCARAFLKSVQLLRISKARRDVPDVRRLANLHTMRGLYPG